METWNRGGSDLRERERVIRAGKLRVRKSYMEQAVQHLYPLELSCDRAVMEPLIPLSTDAPEFTPRRAAAQVARERIQVIANFQQSEL